MKKIAKFCIHQKNAKKTRLYLPVHSEITLRVDY